jgi:hypothetical protein
VTAVRSWLVGAADLLDPTPNPYVDDPAGWVEHRLGERLWSKQVQILESVRDNRRTAVHACHAAGKSKAAALAACWWLDSHPPGEAFVVSTAPSWPQVRSILWREIGRAHRKGRLLGRVNQTEWWLAGTGHYTHPTAGEEQIGYGRKPPDQDAEYTFQGIHARYVLVLVDEAGGIPPELWEAIGKLLTTADCRVLAIGNPDYEGSPFWEMCQPGSGWNVVHVDGFATPNFTDEPKPPDAPLIDQAFVDDTIANYGADSPQYLSQVRGLFPADKADGVIAWSHLKMCQGPEATRRIGELRRPVELGVDVGASDNGDLTVVRERNGGRAGRRWSVQSGRPEEVASLVVRAAKESEATKIKVDEGGVGWALAALVTRDLPTVEVVPVQFGAAASEPARFVNVRAELWWEVGRQLSQDGGWDLSEVSVEVLHELAAPKWWESRNGRIQIEEKAEVRRRLGGRSTDDADALLLAFYDPPKRNYAEQVPYDRGLTSGRRAR